MATCIAVTTELPVGSIRVQNRCDAVLAATSAGQNEVMARALMETYKYHNQPFIIMAGQLCSMPVWFRSVMTSAP